MVPCKAWIPGTMQSANVSLMWLHFLVPRKGVTQVPETAGHKFGAKNCCPWVTVESNNENRRNACCHDLNGTLSRKPCNSSNKSFVGVLWRSHTACWCVLLEFRYCVPQAQKPCSLQHVGDCGKMSYWSCAIDHLVCLHNSEVAEHCRAKLSTSILSLPIPCLSSSGVIAISRHLRPKANFNMFQANENIFTPVSCESMAVFKTLCPCAKTLIVCWSWQVQRPLQGSESVSLLFAY